MKSSVRSLVIVSLSFLALGAVLGRATAAPLRAAVSRDRWMAGRTSHPAGVGGRDAESALTSPSQVPLTTTSDPADVNWDDRFARDYGPNGSVNAMVVDGNGAVYVGGGFTRVPGLDVGHIAKWDGATWSALGTGMDGWVGALALDGSGNLYAGGHFTAAGGVAVRNIAKWDGASWSALGLGLEPASSSGVNALALDGSGNLYAGGDFTTAGGVGANKVAKWDGANWSALGTGTDGYVRALALDGSGNLYAGGYFSTAGGITAYDVAKWDGANWSALSAQPPSSEVFALAVDGGGSLYAGGYFDFAGGNPVGNIAKWNGANWSALAGGLNGQVNALETDGSGNLYVGGNFSATSGGMPARAVAKWNGVSWSSLGAGVYGGVGCLAPLPDGSLYAGGLLYNDQGGSSVLDAANLLRWTGTSWDRLTPGSGLGASAPVYALVRDNSGNIIAGGDFDAAGTTISFGGARWNGTAWSPMDEGLSFNPRALAVSDGRFYAGGAYEPDPFGGYVAKWNGSAWAGMDDGFDFDVYALAADGSGNLYAGGAFQKTSPFAGGATVNYIAKWDGTTWSALGSGMNDRVMALAVDGNGNLYAGGFFTTAGGVSANRIAKWDGTTWSALGTGMGGGSVRALALDANGNLYAAGFFTTAGGVSANRVAKWNGTTWSALGSGMNGAVRALTLDGSGSLYAGGDFTTADGGSANRIARWNGTSWSALGSGVNGPVFALRMDLGGNLCVGGDFTTAGGKPSEHFGIWLAPPVISATAGAGGSIDPSGSLVVTRGSDRSYTITPAECHHIVDVLVDGQSVGPLPSYTFTNVQANHTISASFAQTTYTITTHAGAGGSIDPAGPVGVDCGADRKFVIMPDPNFDVADVLVDGGSVGAVTSYAFTSVQTSHTLDATFVPQATAVGPQQVAEFALSRVAPIPARDQVWVDYAVAREARVRLSVLDIQGRTVATLADGVREPGRFRVAWGGDGLRGRAPAGAYFVRYEVPGGSFTKLLLLVR